MNSAPVLKMGSLGGTSQPRELMRVRLRLIVAFALLIAALIIVGLQGISRLGRLNAQTHEIFSKYWQKSKVSHEAFRLSNLNNRITLLVFMLEDPKEVQLLLTQRAANTERISELIKLLELDLNDPEEKRLLAIVNTSRMVYVNSYRRALTKLVTEGRHDEARQIMIHESLPLLVTYHDAWDDFYKYQTDAMAAAMLNSKVGFARSRRQFLLLVGAAGLITFVIAGFTVGRTGREIAERREARMASMRLKAVVESSSDAIIGKDQNSIVTSWNKGAEKIFGYTAREMVGTSIMRLIPVGREGEESHILAKMNRGESVEQFETLRQNKDGRLIDVSVTASPIRDVTGNVVGVSKVVRDITERKWSEAELEKVHKQLLITSRQAGMAEVATSVLHNVGNVLNSVNIASSCMADSLKASKSVHLSKLVDLLQEHKENLGDFFTNDSRGQQVPVYLAQLAEHLASEQANALRELAQLQKNIEHIKDIVMRQQSFAKTSGATEAIHLTDLVEDALRMNFSELAKYDIEVIKEFNDTELVTAEKHKVLQILVNLVSNAKDACEASELPGGKLTIRTSNGQDCVRITVGDTGVGILAENLDRVFSHGFTTKKDGHGFGLHSGALAAGEMGGSLTVHSNGPGHGATFTLELPRVGKKEFCG